MSVSPISILKTLVILLIGVQAIKAQVLAVLEVVPAGEEAELSITEFRHLTDELRTQAREALPRNYSVLTRDNIIQLIPPEEIECIAEGCAVIIGRAIGAEYVTQGFVGRFEGMLTLTVELHESMSGNMLGSFVTESENARGLLSTIRERAPRLFARISNTNVLPVPETQAEKSAEKQPAENEIDIREELPEPVRVSSDADKRRELLGTVQVSRVHAIDEFRGTYKSPRRAMFMSLVLPGSGQMYVGTTQSRYIRGAFYMAEEIALISGLYYYSVHKYDKQVKKYQNFAKDNFKVSNYESAMNSLFNEEYKDKFQMLYGSERENYCRAFYGSSANRSCIENFGINYSNHPGDNTPLFYPNEFYRIIGNENFILGWVDAAQNPGVKENLFTENPQYMPLGTSVDRDTYMSMRKKANSLADRQAIFIGAILLNHIVSAIDAALAAKAHNSTLYEEKISFLDKIRLGSDIHIGENFKAGAGLWYYF
ncbi:MAG: DUF5683 domain-containing protein [Fibromonadaceae bacterium]|jgi:hypothetical protein|nr:DUF5683 domain-containing protein [Fibromonadaceae bacterium]